MYYKRHKIIDLLEKNLARDFHVLQILLGPRQVGKTTTIEQLLAGWPDQTLYATADQLTPPDIYFLQAQWEKARRLTGKRPLLVVDEVQKITRWSEAVKKFHDEDVREGRSLRVVLLGSSSLLIQKGMSESLTGRFQLIRCPHWSYLECREAFGWPLEKYLFFGGYPAGARLADDVPAWRDYIQNAILETVIGRDIPLIRRVEHPALFRQTLSLACQHPAHILSLQKMVGQLQERGSINTVADYLDLLASAFLVEPIQKWSPRPLRTRSSIPKIIVRNSALVNALRPATPEEALADTEFRGHLVENAIGASLLNEEKELFYWNDRKYELDFVVREGERLLAIEVKSGRKRSAPGLGLFLKRVPQAKGLIIGGEGADLSLEDFFRHGITI